MYDDNFKPELDEQEIPEFVRIITIAVFAGPAAQFLVLLVGLIMYAAVFRQGDKFVFVGDWVDVDLFWGFWFTGAVMFIVQAFAYVLGVFCGKAKIKYYMLFSSALVLIVAEQMVVMNREIYFIEHHAVYAFFFSTIMLAVFTPMTILFDKLPKLKEKTKFLLSFSLAFIIGMGLSYVGWITVLSILDKI